LKYKSIRIETNGTTAGTKIFVDDKQLERAQRIEFSADVNELFAHINIQVARQENGVAKTKKVKVRDKTEKFIEKDEIETEPLNLERQV
jgi:hypothetical protein